MDVLSLLSIAVMLAVIALAPMKRFGLVQLLIIGNIIIFVLELLSPREIVQLELGFRPTYLISGDSLHTVLTSMFVHASFLHIASNMLFLFLIGLPLEERVGKVKFGLVYFIGGVIGLLAETLVRWDTSTLILGASAAISAAMGAMLILYPRDKIPFFLWIIFIPNLPVWAGVGSWFGLQVFYVFTQGIGPVAYTAHLGAFLAGMLLGHYLPAYKHQVKLRVVSTERLEELATTPQLKSTLERIRGETQPDVKEAWLEYFAKHAQCPQCGSHFELKGNKLKSECGFEVELK